MCSLVVPQGGPMQFRYMSNSKKSHIQRIIDGPCSWRDTNNTLGILVSRIHPKTFIDAPYLRSAHAMIPTPKIVLNMCHLRIVSAVGDYQLLSSWTLPKFYARLEMMYEVPKNLTGRQPQQGAELNQINGTDRGKFPQQQNHRFRKGEFLTNNKGGGASDSGMMMSKTVQLDTGKIGGLISRQSFTEWEGSGEHMKFIQISGWQESGEIHVMCMMVCKHAIISIWWRLFCLCINCWSSNKGNLGGFLDFYGNIKWMMPVYSLSNYSPLRDAMPVTSGIRGSGKNWWWYFNGKKRGKNTSYIVMFFLDRSNGWIWLAFPSSFFSHGVLQERQIHHMGVSKNNGTPKTPQNDHS